MVATTEFSDIVRFKHVKICGLLLNISFKPRRGFRFMSFLAEKKCCESFERLIFFLRLKTFL